MCANIVTANINFTVLKEYSTEGKNSKVYLVKDNQLDCELILKAIPKASFSSCDEYFKEASTLYAQKHPNIMDVQYACEYGDMSLFTMPVYNKGSLGGVKSSLYTCREILKYAFDVVGGLHYIHCNGLVHLDIKPSNVLVGCNNVAVLSDFGFAKFTDTNGFVHHNTFYGTHYPPERLLATHVTNLSDIYQVGITLYRLCNGEFVFQNQVNALATIPAILDAIKKGRFPNRKTYLPHIPLALRRIINKSINTDPDKRYRTVLDLKNALAAIDGDLDWRLEQDLSRPLWTWRSEDIIKSKEIVLDMRQLPGKITVSKLNKRSGKVQHLKAYSSNDVQSIEDGFARCQKAIFEI